MPANRERFDLAGRRVLLTGGGGAIGGATARLLTDVGATVVELSHRARHGATSVDFRDDTRLHAAVAALAPVDDLVLCHGAIQPGSIEDVSPQEWRRLMDVNVHSMYAILHAAIPSLGRGSAIVVVSSTAGLGRSRNGGSHYTASKWALNGLVKHLAGELGPKGIRINAVCPGHIDNEMARSVNTPESLAAGVAAIPLGRGGTDDEVAAAILFLVSQLSSYVTGVLLPVAGGTH
jgi:3-oxoacyl-[acyl-carrier protein] reductase